MEHWGGRSTCDDMTDEGNATLSHLTFHEARRYSGPRSATEARRDRPIKNTAGLSRDQLLELYRLLYETRRLEEHLVILYKQNHVVGGVYRSLGQEATAVGCAYAMRANDLVQPLIRDLGA